MENIQNKGFYKLMDFYKNWLNLFNKIKIIGQKLPSIIINFL